MHFSNDIFSSIFGTLVNVEVTDVLMLLKKDVMFCNEKLDNEK